LGAIEKTVRGQGKTVPKGGGFEQFGNARTAVRLLELPCKRFHGVNSPYMPLFLFYHSVSSKKMSIIEHTK
jgi:hypothetical protein